MVVPTGTDDFYLARLPFHLAQDALDTGTLVEEGVRIGKCGWHGNRLDKERGSFVIVNSGGPLTDLVGERLRVTAGRADVTLRSVVAYCHTRANLADDLSVTRRLFLALGVLGDEAVAVEVEVIA